ncbi:protein of unknown function DUF2914 [Citrifermentans bemidjiense Bem]|uniref:DUF2914 domain-containing protein n=1 Tax=Citrifermentans bemidjiense (strain ATCC BAA-1014 / DSM 16622 / JCM 12645 / Bem) TaxID=404380 RepID=B5E810_CITBB|nr:DUF2914 domain-containing protein [Citrifermentans bemidjiense]ACH38546.1 protein of unknown function DUF2914 [Citrifermentans bemidjiense Bem]
MNRTTLFTTVAAILFILLAGFSQSHAADLKITEMAVTTKIVKGNPIDSVRRISSASVKALYCFTRFSAPEDTDTTIKQLWYLNDEVVAEYELPVKGAHWRTYSRKVVEKGLSGEWRCDAVDGEGKVLKSVNFRMN